MIDSDKIQKDHDCSPFIILNHKLEDGILYFLVPNNYQLHWVSEQDERIIFKDIQTYFNKISNDENLPKGQYSVLDVLSNNDKTFYLVQDLNSPAQYLVKSKDLLKNDIDNFTKIFSELITSNSLPSVRN